VNSSDQWLEALASINQWRRGGQRAPHKPLLLLYALARFQRGLRGAMTYADVECDLDNLLREFGPPRRSSPSYPFDHLASDGLWIVSSDEGKGSPGDARGRLRSTNARGCLDPDFEATLVADTTLLPRAVRLLLDANFEPSVQSDLLDELGLNLVLADTVENPIPGTARRDSKFRNLILVAYEYRCAMCGFDPQIDNVPVAIDAAHVRWWAAGGPDALSNGMCLCSLHHKLFDRGVLGLDADKVILVSDRFRGSSTFAKEMVLSLTGQELRPPQPGRDHVDLEHIAWHRQEVFRGDPRSTAA
jgi:putative restriction endonuclease